MNLILTLVIILALLLAGFDYLFHRTYIRRRRSEAEARARSLVEDAERQAELLLKEVEIETREKTDAAETALEQDTRKKRLQFQSRQKQVEEQERTLERKAALISQKQTEMEGREKTLVNRETALISRQQELQDLIHEQRGRLEKMAGMSTHQAKRELVREMESQARSEVSATLKRIADETRARATADARRIVAGAMQRVPVGQVVDLACSLVTLPNDEMKGRIIGREGRNIRALEMATGIDLIVDDTPSAIILSGFDPLRREIAKVSIERLVEDGRIHPGRIEEVVQKTRLEIDQLILQSGETAAFEMGIVSLAERLIRLVGKMGFFTISGYNLLQHCKEVAHLASFLAAEFEIGVDTVKRAGLLHGIGLIEDGDNGTPHLVLASEICGRLGESLKVTQAIRSLQPGETESSLDSVLLKVARKVSLSRPGMRRDNMDIWIGRMKDLERIALSFRGVDQAYAMRSGKEVRVIVESEEVSDADVVWLSKDIASRIERELNYPGQVRVSVIRETRAIDFAK